MKALSSPSRGENFPPPLMRFLRSNTGSRSRSRSRSSPIFYRRTKKAVIETTQEPSSPKVTCIGQVRVRRSAKSSNRRCWWIRKALVSPRFIRRRNNTSWWSFCSFRDCFRVHLNSNSRKGENVDAVNNGGYKDKYGRRGCSETTSFASPPKNALMLTRCRSASWLGGRFWGWALPEKDENGGESGVTINVHEEDERSKEMENSGENSEIGGGAVQAVLLTRCKSGPARIGERLDAEAILLSQTTLPEPRIPKNS